MCLLSRLTDTDWTHGRQQEADTTDKRWRPVLSIQAAYAALFSTGENPPPVNSSANVARFRVHALTWRHTFRTPVVRTARAKMSHCSRVVSPRNAAFCCEACLLAFAQFVPLPRSRSPFRSFAVLSVCLSLSSLPKTCPNITL